MEPLVRIEAIAAPIDERNLDTNQLCPTRFNKLAIDDPFYPRVLFHNQRFAPDGTECADFILNQPHFRDAGILVANENFGCGSSRESAIYALAAFGIRVVIAPSFGDIFRGNAISNGLLPVVLPAPVCDALRSGLHAAPGTALRVDLEHQRIEHPGQPPIDFSIEPAEREGLMRGLDAVGSTLEHRAAIGAFEARHRPTMPWFFGTP